MISPSSSMAVASAITAIATGTEQEIQITRMGSKRVAQLEQAGFEMGRVGRSFFGCTSLVAGGVVPVVDLPTTTGPWVLYNANAAGSGKLFHIKRVAGFYASGTGGNFGLFGGTTPLPLATALTANGATNFKTQATRGYGLCNGYVDVAKTIAAGTAWMHFGAVGAYLAANALTGPAYSVHVSALGIVVPPTYAFTLGALGDTGTTLKFGFSVAWDEIDADLP